MTGEELQEIRALLPEIKRSRASSSERYPADFDWAVEALEEVLADAERLRGLLARLEWAGGDRDGSPCCPVCAGAFWDEQTNMRGEPIPSVHDSGCWLADELAGQDEHGPQRHRPERAS